MFWNALLLALREIRRSLMRSFLTILGIVIGVAAVIVMVTIGGGATVQVTEQIASLGSNLLQVRPGQGPRGPGGKRSDAENLKMADAEAINREISGLTAVAPVFSQDAQAIYGNEKKYLVALITANQAVIEHFAAEAEAAGRPLVLFGQSLGGIVTAQKSDRMQGIADFDKPLRVAVTAAKRGFEATTLVAVAAAPGATGPGIASRGADDSAIGVDDARAGGVANTEYRIADSAVDGAPAVTAAAALLTLLDPVRPPRAGLAAQWRLNGFARQRVGFADEFEIPL